MPQWQPYFQQLSPKRLHSFFAYLRTITKASCTFESSAWASYDMAYRRQAANHGSLDWAMVDAALYNKAFAGRARSMPRCKYCLADTHPSQECVHAPVESSGRQMGESRARRPYAQHLSSSVLPTGSVEIYPTGSRCRFPNCRYAHLCSKCKRPHPFSKCGGEKRQTGHLGSPTQVPPPPPPTSA